MLGVAANVAQIVGTLVLIPAIFQWWRSHNCVAPRCGRVVFHVSKNGYCHKHHRLATKEAG